MLERQMSRRIVHARLHWLPASTWSAPPYRCLIDDDCGTLCFCSVLLNSMGEMLDNRIHLQGLPAFEPPTLSTWRLHEVALVASQRKSCLLDPSTNTVYSMAWSRPQSMGTAVKTSDGFVAVKQERSNIQPLFERVQHAALTASLQASVGADLFKGFARAHDDDQDGSLSAQNIVSLLHALLPDASMADVQLFQVWQNIGYLPCFSI